MAKNNEKELKAGRIPARGMRSSSQGFQDESARTISTIHHSPHPRDQKPPKPRQIFEAENGDIPLDLPKYKEVPISSKLEIKKTTEQVPPQDKPRPRSESVDNTGSSFFPSNLPSKKTINIPENGPPKQPGKFTVTTKQEDGVMGKVDSLSQNYMQRVCGLS